MNLFDLHVCTKGMAHPDNCRNYFWLKANEVNDMVSVSREEFAKSHDPMKGGKLSEGNTSYEWKARDEESGSPMEKWAKGSFGDSLPTHGIYTCASCGLEGKSRSEALGRCESCGTAIPKFRGFKASAKNEDDGLQHFKNYGPPYKKTEVPTSKTDNSAPGQVEQAGHEGCDPSNPSERSHSGEVNPMELDHNVGKHTVPMDGCPTCGKEKECSGMEPMATLSKFDAKKV